MASQLSQMDALNIYFVIFSKHKSEDDCSEDMWEAFIKCRENDMEPQWVLESKCSELNPGKTDIFVLEEFEGELFKKLEITKCFRVVGPRCLLRCFFTGESVPPGTSPVFTTAMKDFVVCASGFNSEIKDEIRKKVEYMGGIFIKELRTCITHLVTDSVMSAKYEKATENKIPVFTYEWIKAVWNANLTEFTLANDPSFDKYKCSTFMNLIVTASNLPKRQKEEAKKLINENGGEFMGPLDGTKVKVVLAPDNSSLSEKIKFALQNNIACLKFEWVIKSVNAGYALPFNNYLITPAPRALCSTPENGSTHIIHSSLNFSAISNIPNDNNRNFIEESMSNTISINRDNIIDHNISPYVSIVERLDIREAKLAGPFLDGCSIYVTGFQIQHRDKINKILNVGSATRFDDISDALTHVIVGDLSKASNELKMIQSKGINPHILKINWLEESIKLKKPASEELFGIDEDKSKPVDVKKIEPQSPLSKRSIQMLQKSKRPPIPQFDIDKPQTVVPNADDDDDDDEPNIVQQYLQKSNALINHSANIPNQSNSCISTDKNSCLPGSSSIEQRQRQTINNEPANDSEVPLSQPYTMSEQFFTGLTFLVLGFDDEENALAIGNIDGLGGRIVTNSYSGVPDYGVVPITGAQLRHTVSEIVTNLYIEDCINNEKIIDIAYYHRPLAVPASAKPLADCVIAISSYSGFERIYLTQLAVALGARHQDLFARRTNIEKGQYAGTHLICTAPVGNKYVAAVKWNLPAVTAEWLLGCAKKLQLIDETPYLVGETVAPIRENNLNSSIMAPPINTPTRQILTPKRTLTQTPGLDTPIINKRLSLAQNNSINSPFHVSTPDTPYGQIFKPNPSPDTRKCWAKWIDDLPDKVEPPAKRRAPSTPLSELKRQIWSAMKKPIGGAVNQQDHSTMDDHDELSVNKDDEMETPINRVLSFTEDEENPSKKNALDEQLEQMDKILRATSTSETRCSLHSEKGKAYEEPRDHIMPSTQPESVCWEDPKRIAKDTQEKLPLDIVEEISTEIDPPRKRKFMLSGLRDRSNYEEIIKHLGGEVSPDATFDATATHLLCVKPSRNEKMLGSIAAGKWILHCSYLRDCERAGEFIDEEKYEWGNPRSKDIIPIVENEPDKSYAAAAYRWRVKLQGTGKCAFNGMVAMLMVPNEKHDQLARLIKAGGGTVVQAKPPYDTSPNGKKVTHCFIQINKLEQPVDWAMLASKGIWCYLPPYLGQYLAAVEPLNPRDGVIPEFKKYLTLMPKL
ncbi:hypothetical protein PV325_002080 [Microctonus aethiopoides]|nr:hypothetical protein PV325_002080 [Microctonus aethiopoides]